MAVNIAIDGPAGAGKSSIAKRAAAALGYIYVDTGALYRTIGLNALRRGVDTKDAAAVIGTLADVQVSLRFVDGEQRVFLGEEDVSAAIRTPEASMAASHVSAIPAVREHLFALQQNIAAQNNCLMDGRDIGTVVLPNADVKIFLTASAETRADRRCRELAEKGMPTPYDEVLRDIIERDYNDSHRDVAPLKQAEDAVLLDTSALSFDESYAAVVKMIKERIQ
ncbi:MAG: (d)CMP kinase [Oscillospiraceae bacterium]|nr:(d)CMP kinase [Oscillospiraceae bacterium]